VLLRESEQHLAEKVDSRSVGSKDAAFETRNILRTENKKADHGGFCWDAVKVGVTEGALV
jgi:hypothetical protein